jgi:hypothetical protein
MGRSKCEAWSESSLLVVGNKSGTRPWINRIIIKLEAEIC